MRDNQNLQNRVEEAAEDDSNPDQRRASLGCQPSLSRREFLGGVTGVTAAALATGALTLEPLFGTERAEVLANELGPLTPEQRRHRAFMIRSEAASQQRNQPLPEHRSNSDEDRYPNRIGSFSKGLPHDSLGQVEGGTYQALLTALSTGDWADFEKVSMAGDIHLKNPQSGLAFDLIGADSHHRTAPPAPAFDSAEEAAEMGELYWKALARDVPFADYDSHPITQAAAADLSLFSDFRGPTANGRVTPDTLFRADLPGVLAGPFVSQFLLKDVPAGPQLITQQIRPLLPVDSMTTYEEWLAGQNGVLSDAALNPAAGYDPVRRFIRNGRDLSEVVHWDWPGQSAFNAMLMILGLSGAPPAEIFLVGAGVPFDPGNPYLRSRSQAGFVTFHVVQAVAQIAAAAQLALKAAWFQKWFVHRRLRPEEFGGRIHNHTMGAASYPLHPEILSSSALDSIVRQFGSFLLPQAYPEGCPCHPAYPSGHSAWAGATITMLKAFFDESALIPDPVVSSPDGLVLVPYQGPDADQLTVGGELNKLAWNIGIGRNFAGIHWRTDTIEGLRLGEQVAISILRDLRLTYNEPFDGFTFTTFDGQTVTG